MSTSTDLAKQLDSSKRKKKNRVDVATVDQDDRVIDSFSAPGGIPSKAARLKPESVTDTSDLERPKRSLEKTKGKQTRESINIDPTRFLGKRPSVSQIPIIEEHEQPVPETPKTELGRADSLKGSDTLKAVGPTKSSGIKSPDSSKGRKSPTKRRSADLAKNSEISKSADIPDLSLKPSSSIKKSDSMKTSDGKSSDSIKSSGSTKSISSKKLKISDDPTTSPEVGGDTPAVVKPASPSKPVKPSDPKPIKSTDPNFEKLKASDTPQPQKDEFPTLATIYPLSLPFKKKISSGMFSPLLPHLLLVASVSSLFLSVDTDQKFKVGL